MSDLITIKTFNNPTLLGILRSRLESENITCFVQDEAMAQTAYYSGAVGGAKLQVKREDVARTVEIMLEAGYLTEDDLKPKQSKIEMWIYNLFHKNKLT